MTFHTPVRSEQRLIVTIVALILGPVFMIGPAAVGIAIAIGNNFAWQALLLLPFCVCVSLFIGYHMFQNYQWVELDGDVIRGQRFWTRQYVERRVEEISEVVPLRSMAKTIETAVADQLLGPIHGYEIRFKHGVPKIGLVRHDMANVDVLVQRLVDQMQSNRERTNPKLQ